MTEKVYRKLIDQVLNKINNTENILEWHGKETLEKIGNVSWGNSISYLHSTKQISLDSRIVLKFKSFLKDGAFYMIFL